MTTNIALQRVASFDFTPQTTLRSAQFSMSRATPRQVKTLRRLPYRMAPAGDGRLFSGQDASLWLSNDDATLISLRVLTPAIGAAT